MARQGLKSGGPAEVWATQCWKPDHQGQARHVVWMPDSCVPSMLLYGQLKQEQPGLGRPLLHFRDSMKANLKSWDIAAENREDTAADRGPLEATSDPWHGSETFWSRTRIIIPLIVKKNKNSFIYSKQIIFMTPLNVQMNVNNFLVTFVTEALPELSSRGLVWESPIIPIRPKADMFCFLPSGWIYDST